MTTYNIFDKLNTPVMTKTGNEYEFIIDRHINFIDSIPDDMNYLRVRKEYFKNNNIISISSLHAFFGSSTYGITDTYVHSLNHPAKIWCKQHSISSNGYYEWWFYGENRTNDVEKWLIGNGYETDKPLSLEQRCELKLYFGL